MKKMSFEVAGMKCSGCSSKIESALTEMDGVELVEVSLEDKTTVVSFDETQNKSMNYKIKIEELGFQVLKMQKI